MTKRGRTIFRPEAVQRYARSREHSVLPHLTCPRALRYLWLLLGLLLVIGSFVWIETGRLLLGN
jgi:hypothetical protein